MYEYKAKVVRVVDGDTIDVDLDLGFSVVMAKTRIRLYGIDTPEKRTRDLEEKKFGLLATALVEEYCPVGSTIVVKTRLDGKGKFGRILGEIIVDGLNLNEFMIQEHYAVAYHGQAKADIEAEHLVNRQFLIEAGKI